MFYKCLSVFFISMLPFVELRLGIPFGEGLGIPMWLNYPVCIIGNMLPVPFILFFAKAFLDWTADQKPLSPFFNKTVSLLPGRAENGMRRFIEKFQKKCGPTFKKIITKAESKASTVGKFELLGIFLFVAVPLPGTGAWTGTLVASILRLRTWKAVIAVFLGVVASGTIMALGTYFVSQGIQAAI